MKITLESIEKDKYWQKVTKETNSELASEVLTDFLELMTAIGFHPNSIKSALLECVEDIELNKESNEKE